MNDQQIKQHIREWTRCNGVVTSEMGELHLERQIGESATSLVLETSLGGRKAAIKFLTELVTSSPSTRYKRFLAECVNLVALVASGAVVPLYHFGTQDMKGLRIPYIVMERCIKSLHEQYRSVRLKDADEFDSLLMRLLSILEVIHNEGIVHRDVKPRNILLRQNGEWVLGDFGIAWFDPEFYDKLAQTKNGDRLANWRFSAPEQFRRDAYDIATPCLDLYALGQTLYYCVSGRCITGTNYRRFAEIAPSLEDYDSLIDRLVRQEPEERLKSVSEVRSFLEENRSSGHSIYFDLAMQKVAQTLEFELRLARGMPGSSDVAYKQARDRSEINRVLSSLAEDCERYNLWWRKGRYSHNPVERMEQLSEGIWLIGGYECKVADLWVHRHPTLERQYVIIQLAPRSPFGVSSTDTSNTEIVVAGYYRGRYVSGAEFDDGYAIIDGDVVKLVGAELRFRNLRDQNFTN